MLSLPPNPKFAIQTRLLRPAKNEDVSRLRSAGVRFLSASEKHEATLLA
jgi:hypothetical protein